MVFHSIGYLSLTSDTAYKQEKTDCGYSFSHAKSSKKQLRRKRLSIMKNEIMDATIGGESNPFLLYQTHLSFQNRFSSVSGPDRNSTYVDARRYKISL
jgi:hypothetical protein